MVEREPHQTAKLPACRTEPQLRPEGARTKKPEVTHSISQPRCWTPTPRNHRPGNHGGAGRACCTLARRDRPELVPRGRGRGGSPAGVPRLCGKIEVRLWFERWWRVLRPSRFCAAAFARLCPLVFLVELWERLDGCESASSTGTVSCTGDGPLSSVFFVAFFFAFCVLLYLLFVLFAADL